MEIKPGDIPPLYQPQHCRVLDDSDIGQARRQAVTLCGALGFDTFRTAEVSLVVTELATNLLKYAGSNGGELVFSPMQYAGINCLDILSLDQGPGIANLGAVLRDSISGKGNFNAEVDINLGSSLGIGLGAVRRLSSQFDIFSAPGQGTAVFSRCWQPTQQLPPPALAMEVGAVCLPVMGEKACGDAWAMKIKRDTALFLLADGLGHGDKAAIAANLAVSIFQQAAQPSPEELVTLIHQGLRNTRGTAVAVAELTYATGTLCYAGLGNISGLILAEGSAGNMISYNGTAGLAASKIQQLSYPWPEDGHLVLHSDGIDTHWGLQDYPGLAHKHPALIAGVLYRDHQRPRDDSSVIVAKLPQSSTVSGTP